MPRVQGCLQHTAFLPYICTRFPGRDPSRGNRLYFCIGGISHRTENRRVICSSQGQRCVEFFSFDASFYAKSPRIAPRAVAIIVMLPNNHAKMASRSLDMFIRPERMRSSWAFLGLVPLAYAQSCFWEIPVIFSRVARENHPLSR